MYWQTQYVVLGFIRFDFTALFIFFGTHFLYAMHRIVGLRKVKPFQKEGRYLVIARFRHHIIIYAVISAVACSYLIFQLDWKLWNALIIPCIFSLAYVLPFLGKNRRLRDFHFIKIFLIAVIWSWLTVMLPAYTYDVEGHFPIWIIFMEKILFVFAITIPFDIRDLQIDDFTKVKTLPSVMGIKRAKWLALILIFFAETLAHFNHGLDIYSTGMYIGLGLSYLSTAILIWYSDKITHDYYFTGLMDGTMIIQFLFVYSFDLLF
jgi:4-hydroxybenzoate polyprenyltransferase